VTRVAGQDRVSANELPTDGYTMLNAALVYRVKASGADWDLFLRATNLLDEEARNHVSVIKDIAPLGRRAAMVGLRGSF
jgi:iron complex outermembrane receptor protein